MATVFDARGIDQHGWRPGAVLGPLLRCIVREREPAYLAIREDDWLIVTSHDCDIVNGRLEKEPLVEIVRAEVVTRALPNKDQSWGRNPRALQLQIDSGGDGVVLGIQVHDRCEWLWSQGLDRIWLNTLPGTRAQGFYERQGWVCRGPVDTGELRFELMRPTPAPRRDAAPS
jgi:hypothetical protein